MRSRTLRPSSAPRISIRPEVAGCRPRIMRRVEVLPAPLGPRKPQIVPFSTSKLRSDTA